MEITNTTQLLEALQKVQQGPKQVDPSEYRYVIYARKSTDDSQKQVRSLPDQIHDCQEFAANYKLRVVGIIQEAESAKEPDVRPKFRQMIEDIKRGKYDAILAWHPDRLSRNMKEAGEIIDLLDKDIIKDLKFRSFTFVNDPSGKMLLGITFVMSKEYSDKLSEEVSRGNRRTIEEGGYPNRAKHGYDKDPNGLLQSDGENFILFKRAFQLRLEAKTLNEIAIFLNKNHYMRWNVQIANKSPRPDHSIYKWHLKNVQKRLLSDMAYAGVVVCGKKGSGVDLTAKYNFMPAVSVPDFMRINALDTKSELFKLARKYRKGDSVKADLLRGMVICADCNEAMTAGITTKKTAQGTTRYFFYRCETEDCTRKKEVGASQSSCCLYA